MNKKDLLTIISFLLIASAVIVWDSKTFTRIMNQEDIIFQNFNLENILKFENNNINELKRAEDRVFEYLRDKSDEPIAEFIHNKNITENSDLVINAFGKNATKDLNVLGTGDSRNEKLSGPLKFVVVGDSFIQGITGSVFEKDLKSYDQITVIRRGVRSTGFNTKEKFDWSKELSGIVAKEDPDVLIVLLGANDWFPIHDDNMTKYGLNTDMWYKIYNQRVNSFLTIASKNFKKVYFIGHPPSPLPGYSEVLVKLNNVFINQISKFDNITYVSSWERLAVNDKFLGNIADDRGKVANTKEADGIHLNQHGSQILSDWLFKTMEKDIEFKKK